ncbi:DUF3986 family protein [Bacillus sp. 165]|uniref:DUF3986 family protein n=1 Tax=Bacillus sp. 165 TaxID=1529117 RepID=UPI001ADBFAD3|nr:DUF3986 family protein [Bacillus sp. 165]MBO9129561.1 DUF3986 family protein [Bacillus sp. 165]
MKNIYEQHQHAHLGYYENGYDLEAIGYKKEGIDEWDIFFEPKHYKNISIPQNFPYVPDYGYKLGVVYANDLSFEEGSAFLEKWLRDVELID